MRTKKNNLCFELRIDRTLLRRRYRRTTVTGAKRYIVNALVKAGRVRKAAISIKQRRGRYRRVEV